MPPWYANQRFGQFKNARGLTQMQIDAVGAWIDGGMPEDTSEPLLDLPSGISAGQMPPALPYGLTTDGITTPIHPR